LYHDLTYEELHKRYLDLELRVTRFSSIEQELINTRDKLDHELVVYKRMNVFISKAIRFRSLNELLVHVSEALIDIFEVQIGYVHFRTYNEGLESEHRYFLEGATRSDEQHVREDFIKLESLNIFSGKMKEFTREEISSYVEGNILDHCLLSKKLMVGTKSQLVLGCATDKRNAPIYSIPDARKHALFTIFVQQVEALVNNLLTYETNRQQVKQIQNSEIELRKLSLIATNTNNSVIITDNYGHIEWVNASFETSTGFSLEEVKGRKPKDFLQVQDGRTLDARMQLRNALSAKKAVEVEILNKDKQGNEYVIALQISPILDMDGDVINFIALQRDITTEVKHRKEIERVNFRMEEISKGSSIGMWEYDLESKHTVWNDVIYDIYDVDRTSTDLYGIWRKSLHPDDFDYVSKTIESMIQGKMKSAVMEYRILAGKDHDILKYVRTTVIPEKFEKSNAIKILGSTIDISATKNFENTILEKNKELVKINGELDQFVYSVSHDLRSPLLSIKGILSVMETAQNDEERNMYLSLIDKSVNRLDGTILEILDFSRNARLEVVYSEFNIRELIENIFSDLAYVTNDPVILNMDIEGTDIVEMDKSRVEILLKNLISNGIKYRRRATEGSFVKVAVRSVEDDYHIIVSDNGEGISEENKQKVFEMFYRASSASSGTGLGLYICKDIVEKMKGTLHLNSQSGVGTEISLILPKRIVHEPLPVN